MATVYLAQDLKHDRQVAVKVLRPELAAVLGAERFLHEIKVTANLQHPHILPLHDSGEADGFLYYVMPYVEGESLRDRLNHERQLSVDEAIEITRAVASALDYAHRHDVIHRDIKPENILLHDGQALVADFGIALAVSAAAGTRLTETGLSLGTPHYMSPEQATADRELDARSDLYSLACVTYEMLAGQPPYTAASAQAVVAKILTEDPVRVTMHRRTVPPHVEAALHQALAKLPADRFAGAAQFAEALASPGFQSTAAAPAGVAVAGAVRVPTWVWPALAVLGIAALWGWFRPQPTPERRVLGRFIITLPASEQLGNAGGSRLVISPDGSTIAYVGESSEGRQLYVRSLSEGRARPLPGSENAANPFYSPDGRWIGFDKLDELYKISLDGGAAVPVSPDGQLGASWGTNDTILYSSSTRGGLSLVSADGGTPTILTEADTVARETDHVSPSILPGGRAALFTTLFGNAGEPRVSVVDLETGAVRHLAEGRHPRYTATGHIVYVSADGVLQAARFDLDRLEIVGPEVPIEPDINNVGYTAEYALAQNGTLVFTSVESSFGRALVLVDRRGGERVISGEAQGYFGPRFSPDGRRIAVHMNDGAGFNVWTVDVDRGDVAKLTLSGGNFYPSWSPDGRYLLYTRRDVAGTHVYRKRADGAGGEEAVFASERQQWETSLAPDARHVVVRENDPDTGRDLWLWTVDGGEPTGEPLVQTPANERSPAVSPDGRYVAYVSDETGQSEIFVQPFPRGESRWQVSTEGGTEPVWSPDGRELFFRAGDTIFALPIRTDPVFSTGFAEPAIQGPYAPNSTHTNYDVHPDGNRFVMVKVGDEESRLMVVVNWFEALRGLAGPL